MTQLYLKALFLASPSVLYTGNKLGVGNHIMDRFFYILYCFGPFNETTTQQVSAIACLCTFRLCLFRNPSLSGQRTGKRKTHHYPKAVILPLKDLLNILYFKAHLLIYFLSISWTKCINHTEVI